MIANYIALTKPKIIVLLLITALGGLFLASDGMPGAIVTLSVIIGGSLAAGGANALNHYIDRDIDLKMKRTSSRPVASGSIKPMYAMLFGILLNVVAFWILWRWANLISAFLTLSATLFYIFIYTLGLKRRTTQNIVIGGAAGSIPPMVGWAAVTGSILDPSPIILFAIVFLWTPPHFWALSLILKDDYAKAGVPMLPVVSGIDHTKTQIFIYTWILLVLSVISVFLSDKLGVIYGAFSIILSIGFIYMAWKLRKASDINLAMPTYLFSMLYLALLFVAMVLESLINY
jgi:protoheme IX farnesyltransferase